MGFFKALGKMIQGRPIFDTPSGAREVWDTDQTTTPASEPPAIPSVSEPATNEETKVAPTFMLQHCETHINSDKMDVTVWATNTSNVDIEIEKCVILDTKTEIDRRLSPGRSHEVVLYRGSVPTTNLAHKANIFYKSIRANEYFRVDFMVEYNHEANVTYTVEELHPEHYAIKELS